MLTGGSVSLAVIFFFLLLCFIFFFFAFSFERFMRYRKDLSSYSCPNMMLSLGVKSSPKEISFTLPMRNHPMDWGCRDQCPWEGTGKGRRFPDYSPLSAKMEGEGGMGWVPPALWCIRGGEITFSATKAPKSFPASISAGPWSLPASNGTGIPLCLLFTFPTSHTSNPSFDVKYLYLPRL